jgi:hypothetical protein
MAYIWFTRPPEGTYVDYTRGMDGDIAYAIRNIADEGVVGIFVADLATALRKAEELEQKCRQELALGLLVQAQWPDVYSGVDSHAPR